MDILTLAMAKKYTDSQRLVEPAEVLTWDGNVGDAELIDGVYLLSTKEYDLHNLESFDIVLGGIETTIDDIVVVDMGDGVYVAGINDGSQTPYVLTDPETGLLVWYAGEQAYVSKLTFKPSTIDPKYLPGVCLPVVKLSEDLCRAAEEAFELTAADGAALDAAYETGLPCVIQCTLALDYDDADMRGAVSNIASRGNVFGYPGFVLQFYNWLPILIIKIDGTWVCGDDETIGGYGEDGEEGEDGEDGEGDEDGEDEA